MDKILYLECSSGISGDMTVAALLDLGADKTVLMTALDSLQIDGYSICINRVKKQGLDAARFHVILEENHEPVHGHDHHHDHHGHHHGEAHVHRNLHDIYEIIERLKSSEHVKELARKMFHIIAEAEAKAHGISLEEVHFHEVGAVDSIIDIISVAVCVDNLGITQVIVPRICEGTGVVQCQHGTLPVPVPAVVNIAVKHNLVLQPVDIEGEMVTPTGAAVAAALKTRDRLPEKYSIKGVGIGAGKREYKRANILRAMLIEETSADGEEDSVWILESNIDDTTGEALGYTMECLFRAGALDVYYTPIIMKKNRPAYMLGVVCGREKIPVLEEIIFKHTTTIGIRKYKAEREVLQRELLTLDTPYGEMKAKRCKCGGITYIYPEYESVAALCEQGGMSFQEAYGQIADTVKKRELDII